MTWSRKREALAPREVKRLAEVPASTRLDAPVPVAICASDPERVARMRAGFSGDEYAR